MTGNFGPTSAFYGVGHDHSVASKGSDCCKSSHDGSLIDSALDQQAKQDLRLVYPCLNYRGAGRTESTLLVYPCLYYIVVQADLVVPQTGLPMPVLSRCWQTQQYLRLGLLIPLPVLSRCRHTWQHLRQGYPCLYYRGAGRPGSTLDWSTLACIIALLYIKARPFKKATSTIIRVILWLK